MGSPADSAGTALWRQGWLLNSVSLCVFQPYGTRGLAGKEQPLSPRGTPVPCVAVQRGLWGSRRAKAGGDVGKLPCSEVPVATAWRAARRKKPSHREANVEGMLWPELWPERAVAGGRSRQE